MFKLDQKVALVTGGGSGIGREISVLFARQGATVYILDIDEVAANKTIEDITTTGGNAFFKNCNVALLHEVNAVVQSIISETERIDIVVNNAGIAHIGNIETTTAHDMDRVLSVNVKGVYYLIHATIAQMKEKGGVVLNMASVASSVGLSERLPIAPAKLLLWV